MVRPPRQEQRVHVARLMRRRPVDIYFTYMPGKSMSHGLEFCRGKRPLFDLLLPNPARQLEQLSAELTPACQAPPAADTHAPRWVRLVFRLVFGALVYWSELAPGPASSLHFPGVAATSERRYWLAAAGRPSKRSIVLVSMRQAGSQSAHRSGGSYDVNWMCLSAHEAEQLRDGLRQLLAEMDDAASREGQKGESTQLTREP